MRIMYSLLIFPFIIFVISMLGIVITRTNIIHLLISINVMLLSISLNFLIVSSSINNFMGLVMAAVFVITVPAVESTIGLSITISVYKIKGSINIRSLNLLKR